MRESLVGLLAILLFLPGTSLAHHGVASLGVAGLEGPGAPIETSNSATLPRGGVLGYMKLDYAKWDTDTSEHDDESDYSSFWMFGLGYGFTSYLSVYLFLPYNNKVVEDSSYNTSGFADMSATTVLGFKYDEGFALVPENESLDDLEDWHFTFYTGLSLPTGDANTKDRDGNIDPGMSLGFGKPSFSAGLTATKPLSDRLTFVGETSYLYFQEYEYDDGNRTQFGDELRFNAAFSYRLLTDVAAKFRLDVNMEANYLKLGRDETNGVSEFATGGETLYVVPGVRAYWKNASLGLGVKLPSWKDLNEEHFQQGAEGTEDYRVICTVSVIF
jgi:hypothetical protein